MSSPRAGHVRSGASEEPATLLAFAEELAREAGALLRAYYGDGSGPVDAVASSATSKSTRTDVVTEADRASERLIVDRITAVRPADGILAEEGSRREGTSGLTWVIDPLDGTVNFLYGFPGHAVSIGCRSDRDEARLVGVVHDPLRDETFTALLGGGAYRDGARLRLPGADSAPLLAEALIATGFSYDSARRGIQADLLATVLPEVRDIRRAGAAALDLCWVASGRLDGCYEAGLAPWDFAAGALVVTEAGGTIDFVDGLVDNAVTIVAATPGLAQPLLDLLGRAAVHGRGGQSR